MPKFTASIFLIAAVLCCSSLAHPYYKVGSDESLERIAFKSHSDQARGRKEQQIGYGAFYNDEATLRRDQNNEHHKMKALSAKKHKRAPDTEHDEAAKMAAAADITSRALFVNVLVNGIPESAREGLRQTLEDAALNQHWDSLEDFVTYGLEAASKAGFHFEDVDDNDFGLDSFAE